MSYALSGRGFGEEFFHPGGNPGAFVGGEGVGAVVLVEADFAVNDGTFDGWHFDGVDAFFAEEGVNGFGRDGGEEAAFNVFPDFLIAAGDEHFARGHEGDHFVLIDGHVVPVADILGEVGAVVAGEVSGGEVVDGFADIAAAEFDAHGAGGFGDDAPDAVFHGGGVEDLFAAGGHAGDGDVGGVNILVGGKVIQGAGEGPAGDGVVAGEVGGAGLAWRGRDAGDETGGAVDGAGAPAVALGIVDGSAGEDWDGFAGIGEGEGDGEGRAG